MKKSKITICILLCLLLLSSCKGTAKNTEYFKEKIDNAQISVPTEVRYYPELFSEYENTDEITFYTDENTVYYCFTGSITSQNEIEYQIINVNIAKQSTNVAEFIPELVEQYNKDGINTTYLEKNGKPYAITHEIREDMNRTIVNVCYPVSDYVSAYFALSLNGVTEINNSIINKICSDTELIAL